MMAPVYMPMHYHDGRDPYNLYSPPGRGLVFQTSGTRFLAARNSSVVLDNSCEQTDSAAAVRTKQGKSAMLPFLEAACHSGSMA